MIDSIIIEKLPLPANNMPIVLLTLTTIAVPVSAATTDKMQSVAIFFFFDILKTSFIYAAFKVDILIGIC
jgi:hypothetical protein